MSLSAVTPGKVGAEAFAQEPDKVVAAPTLTDAETAEIQGALRRGKWTREITIGNSKYLIATLTHAEEKENEVAKIMLDRQSYKELLKVIAPPVKEGEKPQEIYISQEEISRLSSASINLYWMALHLKAIDGESLTPDQAKERIMAMPAGFTTVLVREIVAFNEYVVAQAMKTVQNGANLKK